MKKSDKAICERARALAEELAREIEDVHSVEDEKFSQRTDRWADSEKGQEAYSKLERLREAFEHFDHAVAALEEVLGNSDQ